MIGDIIKAKANHYIGEHEKPANSGFIDSVFEERMKQVGWLKGQAWCAYFAELVWTEAYTEYKPELLPRLKQLFAASATAMYKNFSLSGDFKVSKTPEEGAMVMWREGIGWQGHTGIVTAFSGGTVFNTVEGNTNTNGSREGVEVAAKIRPLDWIVKQNGLNLIGFVIPVK